MATALVLSVAAAAHAAVASAQRHDDALVQAVTNRASVVAEVEVEDQPRQLAVPGRSGEPDRWAVPAVLQVLVFDGRRVEARAAILVLGGAEWGGAEAGERFRIAGRLKPAAAGEAEAAMLSVTANPVRLSVKNGREPEWSPDWESGRDSGSQLAPGKLRSSFAAAAEALPGDARGLLPGMVTGDTAALDPELAAAMRVVGMTHLTAVSGANCSLVLGALLLAARSLRLPRPVAAVLALAGLGLFVLMVGPEPSVLRAACMGAIGLSALTAGRSGRGLSLLCVTSIGLLLADPALAADFGFLLSVLATLGIIVAGRPIMEWLPAVVPRAVAAALAVPLSAQVFCGPVIVLLQPQFSSYSLAANLASGALVAPVTLLGTLAVPLVPWAPALAAVPVTTAGAFASGVAGIARYFAALPGAALPWPEGAVGAVTMAVFSALTLAAVWLATHRAAAWDRALELHAGTTRRLDAMLDRGIRRTDREPAPSRRGLVDRSRRGRLRVCKPTFRRNHQWLLPNPNAPGPRRRTPPPGAT
ncbi:ComEC/Rec2 family competence protein [Arthrobacter sp. B3I4]|uniref:ComEC/Rec2 family competence protein n=1 Tax=Arthrobacter sp. B3I4 TaxID=3042267 RepID=UPI0027D8A207|nr:ComEC/Rec2 family competence protein [Arthrobacter sp. B3I4]